MKKLVLIALVLIPGIQGIVFSQNLYQDATILKRCLINDSTFSDSAAAILTWYLSDRLDTELYGDFDNVLRSGNLDALRLDLNLALRQNPFLKKYQIKSGGVKSGLMAAGDFPSIGQVTKMIGGIDVTNFADGLARFMVERAKEELSVTFFQKFKEEIDKKEYADLRILFPETYSLLMTIDRDIYRYNIYLAAMREAFIHDLSGLYLTFPRVMNNGKYQQFFDRNRVLKAILSTSFYIIGGLADQQHPGEIIAGLPHDDIDSIGSPQLSGAIRTLQLFSYALKSPDGDSYWLKGDSLKNLFHDKDLKTFGIYLGLFYEQGKNINFDGQSLTLGKILGKIAGPLDSVAMYKVFISRLVDRTDYIQECLNELMTVRKSDLNYTHYYRYFNAVVDLVEMTGELDELPGMHFMSVKTNQNFQTTMFISRRLGDVYLNVNQTNYQSAIVNLVAVYDRLFKKGGDYAVDDAPSKVLKYGVFMAGVAAANSSSEVKAVIESTALPAGSSILKSYASFNISVNGYLGAFCGYEWLTDKVPTGWPNSAGISAPVGVAFSTGFAKEKAPKVIGALSLFVPLIDVGALASYRFGDSTISTLPEITLGNIIAPGVFVVAGRLFNTPLSAGFGYQYGPQMRKVTADEITTIANSSRLIFFLAVDIPFFNLYSRPKK